MNKRLIYVLTLLSCFLLIACGNDSQAATVEAGSREETRSTVQDDADLEVDDNTDAGEDLDATQDADTGEDLDANQDADTGADVDTGNDFDLSLYSYRNGKDEEDELNDYKDDDIAILTWRYSTNGGTAAYNIVKDGDTCIDYQFSTDLLYCPNEIASYEIISANEKDICLIDDGTYMICIFQDGSEQYSEITINVTDVDGNQYSMTYNYMYKDYEWDGE